MGVTVKQVPGKSGWWVFIAHKGKRKAKRFNDKKAAQAFARVVAAKMALKEFGIQQSDGETVKTYSTDWLKEQVKALKPSTLKFYGDNVRLHIVPAIGTVQLAKVSRSDVKALLVALSKREPPLSSDRVRGVVRTLSTILSEAVEDGKLAANPALRPGRLKRAMKSGKSTEEIDPYTREEADLLVSTAREFFPEWLPFLLTGLRTGMRLGELSALKWGNIDWRARFIAVERSYVLKAYGTPKSGKGRRVDMSKQLGVELRLHRARQRRAFMAAGKPAPELVFAQCPSGAPLDQWKARKALVLIGKKAEIRERGRVIHILRHTFASLLVQQGESLRYVMEQCGHSSIVVTANVYAKFAPSSNRSAVDKLDGRRIG